MKIVAFNGSPRKGEGTTDYLMERFLEGAREAGAEVEKHHVADLDIGGCRGCFGCWWRTPGRCVQRDDMDWVLPAINGADVLLLGTPVYGRNVTSHLARLVERTFPNSRPEMLVEDGETTHPGRAKAPELVLAAACGFPDTKNFGILRALYPSALHIMLPAAQIIFDEEGRGHISDFLKAVKEAGRAVAKGDEVPAELRERLVVDYPDEMKGIIVERHNLYSAMASRGEGYGPE